MLRQQDDNVVLSSTIVEITFNKMQYKRTFIHFTIIITVVVLVCSDYHFDRNSDKIEV